MCECYQIFIAEAHNFSPKVLHLKHVSPISFILIHVHEFDMKNIYSARPCRQTKDTYK